MNGHTPDSPNALTLDLAGWRLYIDLLELSPLFVTVSGAHIYGFPSVDSDVDLRGCHCLPIENIVGLSPPPLTFDQSTFHNGIEVDIVSHDIGKYCNLLVKNNGYVLEQIFSPLVVCGKSFLDELKPIAQKCITRNHFYHYRGFYATQKKLIAKQNPVTIKTVLYAYRVLCTGIELMRSGMIQTDLKVLAEQQQLAFIQELIQAKVAEKMPFCFDLNEHLARLNELEKRLNHEFENSRLPANPDRERVNNFLIQTRLASRT